MGHEGYAGGIPFEPREAVSFPMEVTDYKYYDTPDCAPDPSIHFHFSEGCKEYEYIQIRCWEFHGPEIWNPPVFDTCRHEIETLEDCTFFWPFVLMPNPHAPAWSGATFYPSADAVVQVPGDVPLKAELNRQKALKEIFDQRCREMCPRAALIYKLVQATYNCLHLPCPRSVCGWYRAVAVKLLGFSEQLGYSHHYMHLDMLQKVEYSLQYCHDFGDWRENYPDLAKTVAGWIDSAPGLPAFAAQLNSFLAGHSLGVAILMRELPGAVACRIMCRGALENEFEDVYPWQDAAGHSSPALLRHRIWNIAGLTPTEKQRGYMKVQNAEFVDHYNTLSFRHAPIQPLTTPK